MRSRQLLLITSLAVLILAACQAKKEEDLGVRIDQIVHFYADMDEFTGSVLVAKGDETVLNKSYGPANREWKISNTPTTKFRIGSVTKQFTAAGILLLEEQGKLKTEDLLKTHWPETPRAWEKVTIFHLLTHTSGIPSVTSQPEFATWTLSPSSPEQTINHVRDAPLDFEPGSKYRYNNSGYILLGHLIERLSGQSYADFLKDRIFAPLGMNDSGVDSNTAMIQNRAAGYTNSEEAKAVLNADYVDMTFPHGAGAIYSTTEDLLRWTRGLFGGKLLSPASLEKMTTPFKEEYGFGLGIVEKKGKTVFSHSGGIQGFNSNLTYFPDQGTTIVVLANLNGDAPDAIALKLGALMNGETVVLPTERKETKITEEALAKLVGLYELAPFVNLTVAISKGHLTAQFPGDEPKELLAESAMRFFARDVDAWIEFEQGNEGAVTGVALHMDGEEHHGKRLVERVAMTLAGEVLQQYVGTYDQRDGPTIVTLEDGHLMVQLPGAPKFELYAEAEDRFFMKVANLQIDFTKNQAGRVTGFVMHQNGKNTRVSRRD